MITTTKPDASTINFTQFRVTADKAEFLSPSASDVNTDSLFVSSFAPKRGNNQYGNRRSELNLVRSSAVVDLEGGSIVRNRKMAVTSSIPVGTTEAEIISDAYELGSLLQDPVFVQKAFLTGIIEY